MSESQPIDFGSFVFHVPSEKFVYLLKGTWQLGSPITAKALRLLLLSRKIDVEHIDSALKNELYHCTIGFDTFPNEGPIVVRPEGKWLNVWVPPTLKPADAATGEDFPRILKLLEWLSGGDAGAMDWIFYWMAQKIQNPGLLPGTAPVFNTLPGSGKNSLYEILATILGPENCQVVTRPQLESRFNGFVKSLLILGDEIKSHDHHKEIAEQLKIFITGTRVQLENKGQNAQPVTNRMAWIFASNDRIAPIVVDAGDRRYSVFSNFRSITPEHREMLRGLRKTGSAEWAEDFEEEIRAFWRFALDVELQTEMVSKPYENVNRETLVEASMPSYEGFLKVMHEDGIDALLERLFESREGLGLKHNRLEWDLGARGVSKDIVYRAYVAYCDTEGRKPVSKHRFGSSVLNGTPPLEEKKIKHRGRSLWVWVCPRSPDFSEDRLYSVG